MKNLLVLIIPFSIFLFTSCADDQRVDLESERAKVMQVLDNFVKAHEERNLEKLLSCFSAKPDIIILGTDEDELWVDKFSMGDAQKRAYETFNTVNLSVRDKILKMCGTGHQAWFYMKVNWFVESEGEEFTFDGIRTTGVLENEPDGWKIVQIHTSMPVKGQAVKY
ncbi:MAG: nuclear transport factor 2 family protein [Ignavibacteriaceae bacterium]|nr:nuclear transport factor 2 family protein [Ignavibacteriaceae bacterium]